jgi:hypothetical protein
MTQAASQNRAVCSHHRFHHFLGAAILEFFMETPGRSEHGDQAAPWSLVISRSRETAPPAASSPFHSGIMIFAKGFG